MLHEAGTEQPLSAVICNSVFLIILVVSWLFAVLVSGLGFFFVFLLYFAISIGRPWAKLFVSSVGFKAKKCLCICLGNSYIRCLQCVP